MICQQCSFTNSPLDFFCNNCDSELVINGQLMTLHANPSVAENGNQNLTQIEQPENALDSSTNINSKDEQNKKQASSTNVQNSSTEQPFRIEKKLGEGAVGIVYQAKDLQLDRLIALKVFRSKNISNASREQMLDEARLASAINHPNIVTIYDVSRDNKHCYIAMEWIEGITLEQQLSARNQKFPKAKANTNSPLKKEMSLLDKIACARQIASGLSCAHKMGIIHRDLKPSNIMIRPQEPKVKILDFGIAEISNELSQVDSSNRHNSKFTDVIKTNSDSSEQDTAELNQQETILEGKPNLSLCGTIGYMSPEQSLGEKLTPQSDLFSLGIILYQIFYREHPFQKEKSDQTLAAIRLLSPSFEAPSKKDGQSKLIVPKSIQHLIEQCLEKEISDRPNSAAVAEQLLKNIEAVEKSKAANKGWRYWLTSWRLAIVFVVALITAISVNQSYFTPTVSRDVLLQQGQTIAVLPFSNPSSDPMLAVFAQGLSVSLSNQLALIGEENEGAWVIPATEIGKQKNTSVEAIYKKYNPDLVLTGTIQHLGNTRRLAISILNASDSKLIQSTVYDIPVDRLLESQQEIRNAILALLNWKISESLEQRVNQSMPHGSSAYQHYLQGLGYLYRYDYKNNLDAAITEFEYALERDGNFLDAIHEIAHTYIRAAKIRNDGIWIEQAEKYAEIGIQIAPNNSYSQSIWADVLFEKTQYPEAKNVYEKAIGIDANNAKAYFGLAQIHKMNGDLDKAEQTFKQSLAIDDNWLSWNYLAVFYYRTNQFDKAVEAYRVLQSLTPNNEFAFQISGAIQLGEGKYDEATETFKQAIKLSSSANNLSNLGTAQFYAGNYLESVTSFKQAVDKNPNNYLFLYNLGDAHRWSNAPIKAKEVYQRSLELLNQKIVREPNDRHNRVFKNLTLAKMDSCKLALTETQQLDAVNDSYLITLVAQMYAICNEPMLAIEWINKAVQQNYPLQSIKDEPELRELFTPQFSEYIITKK
ncbi:MAG: protein kinase [Kangiellaceae bacterium]|nr:protein kinase [Kangiellaceae bacterium]